VTKPERLTDGQLTVLRTAIEWGCVEKSRLLGSLWRNFDQLERRGLLTRNGGYVYRATERGLEAFRGSTGGAGD
jgi:hypothetical protein